VTPIAGETRLADIAWLEQGPLGQLLEILNTDGEEARVVGGAVRNTLLREPRGDIDLATTLKPEAVVERARKEGFKPIPTGIEHGTITIVTQDGRFEVTSLREDVETDGRRAIVRFGRDWKRDAERRDFTINALSLSRDGVVHDYVGGRADIEARKVRFIGEAHARIQEDYLRILRFFRFHAGYGAGAPDPDGLRACITLRAGLDQLSRERVRAELMKLMLAPLAAETLEVMSETGLLLRILGGVATMAACRRMIALEAELGIPPDPVRRLAALAVLAPEDAMRLGLRLRLSGAERDRLAQAGAEWRRVGNAADMRHLRTMLYRLEDEPFRDAILLAWARAAEPDASRWREAAALPQHWEAPASPFRAADFVAAGVAKGPALGAALAEAEAKWIAADFPPDPELHQRIIRQTAERHRS
jgi:poly(A) polymerase